MRVYTAQCVLPVVSPPLKPGAIAVEDGRIVASGTPEQVLEDAGAEAEHRDLGSAVLIPGLVNAHVHVELAWMGLDPPRGDGYVAWLRGLLELRGRQDRETALREARRAVARMIERGTVAIGDVANETWVFPVLADSELHGVLFHEIYGFPAGDAGRLLDEAARRLDGPDLEAARNSDRWRISLTPHAPHTASAQLLRALEHRSKDADLPLSIHVAEDRSEVAMLEDGSGPLPALFRDRGMWEEGWKAPGHTPVEYLDRLHLLTPRTVATHCVHLTHQDHSKLQARGVTVVTCPRSNRRLGVGKAPIPQLLGEGIPVALGTDSLASAPDLDLFAEIAALRVEHPKISPAAALRMATLNGARALGLEDRLGSIEPGKLARLVVVALPSPEDDPLATVCSVPATVHSLQDAPWEPVSR